MNACTVEKVSFAKSVVAGMVGGLAGGIVFGMMMAKMGMLPVIASMMGSSAALVGLLVHLMLSVLFGAVGGAALHRVPACLGTTLMFGMGFGVVLWIVGPLLVMPLMMHKPVFMVTETSMMSLMGHLVYGAVMAVVARLFLNKTTRGVTTKSGLDVASSVPSSVPSSAVNKCASKCASK